MQKISALLNKPNSLTNIPAIYQAHRAEHCDDHADRRYKTNPSGRWTWNLVSEVHGFRRILMLSAQMRPRPFVHKIALNYKCM